MDQISHRSHAELLTAVSKQQEKNLAADNEAIQAQQQLLRDLYPDQQSSQPTRHRAANSARPRPRPLENTPKKVQQTCDLASMQAQLSELKKMFCKRSETVNVNKSGVEHYTSVFFPDSKGYTESRNTRKGHRNKKRSFRRNNLKTSLTYYTRAQNEKYIKSCSNKAL